MKQNAKRIAALILAGAVLFSSFLSVLLMVFS